MSAERSIDDPSFIAERARNAKFLRLCRATDAAIRIKRDLQLAYAELDKAFNSAPDFGETVEETETLQDARAILFTRMK